MIRNTPEVLQIGVTFYRWGVIILGVAHFVQAILLWRQLPFLHQFSNAIAPQLRMGLALLWAIMWLVLAVWIGRSPSGRRGWVLAAGAVVYTIYQLCLTLAAASPVMRSGWPVTAGLGLLLIGVSSWIGLKSR